VDLLEERLFRVKMRAHSFSMCLKGVVLLLGLQRILDWRSKQERNTASYLPIVLGL